MQGGKSDRDTLKQDTLNKAYARWAPIYDFVFGKVFDDGRKASIEAAERIGGRILDVGIGTGISLDDFSRKNRIVGVDISEPMLRRAHQRVIENNLTHVECLSVMDAEKLGFPDAVVRRAGGAIRHHGGAKPRCDARRVPASDEARRRSDPCQSHRR